MSERSAAWTTPWTVEVRLNTGRTETAEVWAHDGMGAFARAWDASALELVRGERIIDLRVYEPPVPYTVADEERSLRLMRPACVD